MRFLPWPAIEQTYLRRGRTRLAGPWYDEVAVAGLNTNELIDVLGLDYVHPDGTRAFSDKRHDLGFLRFPVTQTVLRCSTMPVTSSLGGPEPDPPIVVQWAGNGFAPGELLIPERRLASIAVPDGTQIARMTADGNVVIVARWDRSDWESQ